MSRRVGVFWDYENCKPPSGCSGAFVAAKIRQAIQPLGPTMVFKAYMDTSLEKQWEERSMSLPSDLQSSGISLIHCPHNGGKEVADKMLIVDILLFALEQSVNASVDPSTIVLITGDRDYSYLISTLRLRGHDIVLIFPPGSTNAKLKHLATAVLDWRADVIESANPEQHVKHLARTPNISFLPSPASSVSSRQPRSSRGSSVSSLELSRAAPYTQPSIRVASNPSHPRSPSSSEVFSEFELSSDELDDDDSFVCVDEINTSPSHPSSIVDSIPGECSATTSSVTNLFSSFFKRRLAVTPPAASVTDNRLGPTSSHNPTDTSLLPGPSCTSASAERPSNPRGANFRPSVESVPGPHSSEDVPVLHWGKITSSHFREPDSIEVVQPYSDAEIAQSECAASEICLDVFGEPRPASGDSKNGNALVIERPMTPSAVDARRSSNVLCEVPPSVLVRSSQPADPIRNFDLPTLTQNTKVPPPTSQASSKSSSPVAAPIKVPPPPASKASVKSGSPASASSKAPLPPTSKSTVATSSKVPSPTPKAPSMSSPPAAASGSASSGSRFTVLVEVLRNLRKEGTACPDWSIVGSKLVHKDSGIYKKAGCSRLKAYLELAQSNGIIEMGSGGKADAWVRLKS